MWTYLALFLGISAPLVIFIRRFVLILKNKNNQEVPVDNLDLEDTKNKKRLRFSKSDKEKVKALCDRGVAMISAGKDDEAIKCFVKALSIDDSHKETKEQLAMLYMQKQMFSPASALFKQLAVDYQDSVHFSHLGLALYNQSLFEEAKAAYQKSISLDDQRAQRFVSLCQVYRSLEKPFLAIIALNKAINIDPDNTDYLFLLIDLYIEISDFNSAKNTVGEILEIDPESADAKNSLKLIKRLEHLATK